MTKLKKGPKTGKSIHVPRAELFLKRLFYAIEQACERTGWNWSVERQTTTFGKAIAWLPNKKRDDFLISIEIYFDLETRGGMFRYVVVPGFFMPAYLKESYMTEARAFLNALAERIGKAARSWVQEHPEDLQHIEYLFDRVGSDKPKPKEPPVVVQQTAEIKDSLNRELEREGRAKIVAKANELKRADPKRQWREIAKELDLPERTLREWRHNIHYQERQEAAECGE